MVRLTENNVGCKECYDFLMQKSDEMETDL